MNDRSNGDVWVPVVKVSSRREIGWNGNVSAPLEDRLPEIQHGIAAGTQMVAGTLGGLHGPKGWCINEVSASFGITLAAEAGVIVSKASAEATLDVTVTFTRQDGSVERA